MGYCHHIKLSLSNLKSSKTYFPAILKLLKEALSKESISLVFVLWYLGVQMHPVTILSDFFSSFTSILLS